MTKRESIMAALLSKLTSITGVNNAHVYRSRTSPLARDAMPAVTLEPVRDTASDNVIGQTDWDLTFRISIYVRGPIPDQIADPIIESVHSKIMSDVSLGGLSMDIQPLATNFEIIDAEDSALIASLDFHVTYRTSETNLS